jgi:hypothetical protein
MKNNWRLVLNTYYRQTRHAVVDKPAFPGLLKQLVAKMKQSHLVGGFRGTGLWPLNPNAVRAEKIIDDDEEPSSSQAGNDVQATSRKLLREAIVRAIVPPISEENRQCQANSRSRGRGCRRNTAR